MKIGTQVVVEDARNFYDADGIIIDETKTYWKVKVFNHRTFGELWKGKDQQEEIKMFHKKSNINKGFSKGINTGDVIEMFALAVDKDNANHVENNQQEQKEGAQCVTSEEATREISDAKVNVNGMKTNSQPSFSSQEPVSVGCLDALAVIDETEKEE